MIDPQHATPRPQAPVPDDPATMPFPLISDISAARWLLVFIIAAAIYFFHGFLVPVLAATIIAFASWPLSRSVQRALGIDRTITAALFVLVIVLFLVVPIMLFQYFQEKQQEAAKQ